MDILSRLNSWFKNQLIYFSSRQVLAMGVVPFLLAVVFGFEATPPEAGAGAGSVGTSFNLGAAWSAFGLMLGATLPLQGYLGWRKQKAVEERLVDDYRNEIAAQVGVPEKEVTREHLHEVADGNPQKNIRANPVLEQARDRESNRQLLRMITLGGAAAITVAAFMSFAQLPFVQEHIIGNIQSLSNQFTQWITGGATQVGGNAPILTAVLFSGTVLNFVNNTLDRLAEGIFGLNQKTAHELIKDIRRDMNRNRTITKEQVFGVFVAANPGLNAMIEAIYDKPYYNLSAEDQQEVLAVYGRPYNDPKRVPRTVEALTRDLNNGQIEADELAFASIGRASGVPRLPRPQLRRIEKGHLEAISEELAQGLSGQNRSESELQRDDMRMQLKRERAARPANDNVPGFAERFVPKREDAPLSFAEREQRRQAETAELERS